MTGSITIALLWGLGTIAVLSVGKYFLSRFSNPFDLLDDSDIEEIEEAGKNITDLNGKINGF